ncbi:TPA: restriction endonuclease subunit S [Escherichia coli]|nr:restriction endonuclease subunit S [Escherichia coli]
MVYNSPLGKTKFPLAPISDGCTFISGYAFKSKDFTGIGHPVIKIKNIQDGFVILEDSQCVDSKTVEGLNKFKLNNGDILIAMTGQGSVGRVGRLTFDGKKTPYLNQRVGKFIADEKKLNISYLYYILTTQQYQNILFNNASGSGQPNLSPAVIQSTLIPYPEYHLQCEIAKILDTINNRIIKSYAINITLEQMSQTLFKSWFVDFDPVIDNALDAGNPIPEALQARAELRQKVRNSADFKPLPTEIRSLFPSEFEETELGWVPKGWQIKSLDHIANFQNGLALQKFRPKNMEDDYLPVLKIADLRAGQITNDERARTDISDSCKVYDGDMIFSWSGTLMIDIWTGGNAALNQHLYKVTSKKYPQSFYFMWTIQHLSRFQHIAEAKAVTMGHIKKGDLSNSFCLIPTSSLITKYDNIVGGYLAKIKNQRLLNNQMTALRDTLLPKLISGELSLDDIPDLTTDTEAA